MDLAIPDMALVVLIGASGSGKSTFARKHFAPTQVLSSDFFRGLVADDENDQTASADAFDALHYVAGKRLRAGRVTVVDATNVQREVRAQLVKLAREHHVLPVAIVLDLPESVCVERNAARPDRDFGAHVVRRHRTLLRKSLSGLAREGFRRVHVLRGQSEVDEARIVIEPLRTDLRGETGPFDVIGDVHGCRAELEDLLAELGYELERDADGRAVGARHPAGRRAVFVGDLVDRGPDTPGVLRLVMGMVEAGTAYAVCGNHEQKLVRALDGRKVTVAHGLGESLAQLEAETPEFRAAVRDFCDGLLAHYVLDGGRLVVAHAGLPERYHGRASGAVRSFALYGDTTGETDEYGLPVRYPWATEYRGAAMVLYGHTPTPEAEWVNNTMCLDTGVVFGGKLTALRYPERAVVSVPARKVWYEPARPLGAFTREPDSLELTDVLGRRVVETGYGEVSVRAEQAAAALEVMSRYAVDPRSLWYLPPTMTPPPTHRDGDLLEHPAEAFADYLDQGVREVLCEEKHMGSRAVVLARRDGTGVVHTRTGRAFFPSDDLLPRIADAVTAAGLWSELDTDWLLLDTEIMPWNVKAAELIKDQYAAVGAAAGSVLPAAVSALSAASARGVDVSDLLERTRGRADNAVAFRAAYRGYCGGPVRIAPFQVLASAAATYHTTPHLWHLSVADRLVDADPDLFAPTRRLAVDTADADSVAAGVAWWTELTSAGGEGMVVKPAANLLMRGKRPVQPGIKVRGPEYLRIIYGPDYRDEANLARLRERQLGHKRSLAQREYVLGLAGLDRLVRGEPLWRVHECVFAVLALESDPVDPRL
ncbi:polynucleotide kinase-phosphatase [Actinokineospora sp. UTMC 2448]|uniref:polynucleotide kinase-phosphatase n=1 Tax=Actinokineospora sp. UTMC 2448 TaxID=2268449 RepID=UPI0021649358|nr:polynucleotide kinase-phosphatase [Actinokineospora sp. UTMC 2448]UVS77024.1 Bis(5'-nucleosyl)-tetraphosphatase PrpE [asymmetrical] [Actinokineospora sp. UTMC 2448]